MASAFRPPAVEHVAPVEVPPGEVGPEAGAQAEVARGQRRRRPSPGGRCRAGPATSNAAGPAAAPVSSSSIAPVVARRATQSGVATWPAGSGRAPCGPGSARRAAARPPRPPRLAEQGEVPAAIVPQGPRGRQAGDRLGPVQPRQGVPQGRSVAGGERDAGPGRQQQELAAVLGDAAALVGAEPRQSGCVLAGRPPRRVVQRERLLADLQPPADEVLAVDHRVDQAERLGRPLARGP